MITDPETILFSLTKNYYNKFLHEFDFTINHNAFFAEGTITYKISPISNKYNQGNNIRKRGNQ